MQIDILKTLDIIRDVSETEVMDRFRRLSDDEIMEKGPGDLVTVADTSAEAALERRLPDLIAGSTVLGEEEASRNPDVFRLLAGDDPVWVIDPVDGTRNFAKGSELFATMVSLVYKGETLAAWIYAPAVGRQGLAEKGAGCRIDGIVTRMPETPKDIPTLKASFYPQFVKRLPRRPAHETLDFQTPQGAASMDYLDITSGRLDVLHYYKLMPWDHAAGSLMLTESGGHVALVDSGEPYAAHHFDRKTMLATPGLETWNDVRRLMFPNAPDLAA